MEKRRPITCGPINTEELTKVLIICGSSLRRSEVKEDGNTSKTNKEALCPQSKNLMLSQG